MSDEAQIPEPDLGEAIKETGGDTLYWCKQCGLCTGGCPWRLVDGEISTEFNARRLQHMGQLGLEGYESDNNLFACTTCGICVQRCPREVNAIDNIRSMRAMLAEGGGVPSSYKPIVGSVTDNGNPWMGKREERTNWFKDIDVPTFTEDTEYFLYVCCTSCYDARSAKIARAIAQLLNKAGVSWGSSATRRAAAASPSARSVRRSCSRSSPRRTSSCGRKRASRRSSRRRPTAW